MRCWYNVCRASKFALQSFCGNYVSRNTLNNVGLFGMRNGSFVRLPFAQYSSFALPHQLHRQESSPAESLDKLETALKGVQLDEALQAFNEFKRLHGFPDYILISALITKLLYTNESKWLCKAFGLALMMEKMKSGLLKTDMLTKVGLSLARARMPIQASTIIRIMLDKKKLPPMDILRTIIFHMAKTDRGTIIASNILIEISDVSEKLLAKKASTELLKPDVTVYNLVLNACVKFGSFINGLQIIELMAQTGVVADAHTIVSIAQIYEKNYMRAELEKFKKHIDSVPPLLRCHYGQFYGCLLSTYFIYNDLDAASALVLDVYKDRGFDFVGNKTEPSAVPIGSANIRAGLWIQISPNSLQKDSVLKEEGDQKLVLNKNGKMVLSCKALAKLIVKYTRHGAVNKLSNLLCSIKNELATAEFDILCSEIIGAFIHLGWLETAHDILDDLGPEWTCSKGWYFSLLTAYYDKKLSKEGDALLKQINKAFLHTDPFDWKGCSGDDLELDNKSFWSLKSSCLPGTSDLAECIIQEMEEQQNGTPVIHELNSSIYFFVKAKMIEDALKTYRRMREMRVRPTVGTFATLVSGYSSLGMYRDITILWGDIKRNMEDGNSMVYRDLYELLLLNFIRGGYFECALEVIAFMMNKGMYLDKWMYKKEYLKFHKNLYRKLRASYARNEIQAQRLEHVQAFRKLVGVK